METAAALPSVFETLSSTLSSLPANLAHTNLSQLSDLLHSFAADLAPLVPSLSAVQQKALLTNGTFLAAQLGQLSAVTAQIPPGDVEGASPQDLVAIVEIGSTVAWRLFVLPSAVRRISHYHSLIVEPD